jgi:hypothetical protein
MKQPIKRLLYVGFNRAYVNRTFAVLIRALQANHEIDFFGPGYQPEHILVQGPQRWLDQHGPYELLLFDHYTIMHDHLTKQRRPFGADVTYFPHHAYYQYAPTLALFIDDFTGAKCFIVNWDVYGLEAKRTEHLERMGAFIADGSQARETIAERQERFGAYVKKGVSSKGFWLGEGTDHWVNFINSNRQRVLEVPHAIGMDQFSYKPIASRENSFSVPGTNYAERENVYRFLTVHQRLQKLRTKIEDRLYTQTYSSLSSKRLLAIHHRYDAEIDNTKIVYTSGSIYRSPVRKYFEIPALGAMPVGQVMEGFDNLGFRNDFNFIIAETPEEVRRVLSEYKEDEAQRIATNARRLILEQHSEPARARQLTESIKKIVDGSFRGSYWHDGTYCHN